MLAGSGAVVFSKRAVLRTRVRLHDARGNKCARRGRRKGCAIGGWRDAVRAAEAGRERADTLQADREADLGDGAVRRPQQRRGALETARQEVRVRRLAELTPELATEVRTREPRRSGEIFDTYPYREERRLRLDEGRPRR